MFLITLQMATLFDSLRSLLSGAVKIMSGG
jgi:hypothetical protein